MIPDELSDKAILEKVEAHRETAEEVFGTLADDEESMPILVVHALNKKTGETEGAIIGMASEGTMQEQMESVGKSLKEQLPHSQPYCVTFSSEAWLAKFKSEEEGEKAYEKYGKISKMPKRMKKECLIISALAVDGRGTLMTYDIKRKEGKRTIKLSIYKPKIDRTGEAAVLEAFYRGWTNS